MRKDISITYAYNREYHNRPDIKIKLKLCRKEYFRKLRVAVLEVLGGRCVICGFSDSRALQIDHINGDGSQERRKRNFKKSFHAHVMDSFIKKENRYQLLCANCNWIKRVENNEQKYATV